MNNINRKGDGMKTIVINADPKMKQEIGKLLKSASEGAESVGSEVEYFNLYKMDEKILNADTLLIGSQIFFNEPTSHYRALVERLIYCIISYDRNYYYKGKVNVGIFYSVISPKNHFEKNVRPNLKSTEDLFKLLNGEVKVYINYKGMVSKKKTEEEIKKMERQFEIDLKNAFEIGAELSKK